MANEDPNGFPQATPPNDGVPKIRSIFDFTAESLEELAVWLEQRGLTTPITQVIGFSQFSSQSATPIINTETTTSLTYTDLATAGPQLTGLSDGKYVVFFGCTAWSNAGPSNCLMSVKYGAAEATDADGCLNQVTNPSGISRAVAVTLSGGGNNTITARYKVSASTGNFYGRYLVALRYANA